MKEAIHQFLNQKNLTVNSKIAYTYDLEQFLQDTREISSSQLRLYQASLASLKPSVQKRKLSAVNQFLYYLYQQGLVKDFYKLTLPQVSHVAEKKTDMIDLSDFWQESQVPKGRLIALLIAETGLLPSEILAIKTKDVHLDFQIISLEKSGQKRVIQLSERLAEELQTCMTGSYLFDNKGKTYSRQWGFLQLEAFLQEKGQRQLSAQALREQFILHQRAQGSSLHEIARMLGLKTTTTLEKYR